MQPGSLEASASPAHHGGDSGLKITGCEQAQGPRVREVDDFMNTSPLKRVPRREEVQMGRARCLLPGGGAVSAGPQPASKEG